MWYHFVLDRVIAISSRYFALLLVTLRCSLSLGTNNFSDWVHVVACVQCATSRHLNQLSKDFDVHMRHGPRWVDEDMRALNVDLIDQLHWFCWTRCFWDM